MKFTQPEVQYNANGGASGTPEQACSTCRWFQNISDADAMGSDSASRAVPTCHIVENYPAPIASNGWCNQWVQFKPYESEPMEVVIVEAVEVDTAEKEAIPTLSVGDPNIITRVTNALTAAFQKVLPPARDEPITGFKVIGDHWFATYSNIFEDREKEFFPEVACDAYLRRVKLRMVDKPVLAVWHYVDPNNPERGAKVGSTEMVARIGGFMVAAGTFDDTELGRAAKTYYSNPKHAAKTKMSHGFWFNPSRFKDNAYREFNTFEITLLPDGREANSFTGFSVKDMDMTSNITPDARKYMEEVFGKEQTDRLIQQREQATEGLKDLGVRYKDFTTPPEDEKKPKEGEEEEGEKKDLAYKVMVSDLTEGMGAIVDMLKAVAKRQDQEKALIDQLAAKVASVESIVTAPPSAASTSDKTLTDDKDAAAAIADKTNRDQMGQFDPMFPGMNVPLKR